MTSSSSVASSAPASIEAAISAAVLRPIMSKYSSTDISVVVLARPDVDVLALAQRDARLVVQAHQPQDLRVAEAEVGQPMERDPAEAEQHVAGVDRLGDAVERPQRRPMAALAVAVLDVVVDEAEVVAELDRRRARQGRPVVAGDRGVGEEAEERPHPLAGRGARSRRARGGSGTSRRRRRSTDRGRATRRRISASVSAMSCGDARSGWSRAVIVRPSVAVARARKRARPQVAPVRARRTGAGGVRGRCPAARCYRRRGARRPPIRYDRPMRSSCRASTTARRTGS